MWCKFKSGERVISGTDEKDAGTVLEVKDDVNGPVQVHWDSHEITWHGADCLTPAALYGVS